MKADSLIELPEWVAPPHPALALRHTPRGRALYTRGGHSAGETLLEHFGPRASFSAASAAGVEPDHVMEVGENEVFLASGSLDDFVNHSCDPNCRLDYRAGGRVFLVALHDIAPGGELSFDYATTTTLSGIVAFPGWRFPCLCGSPICRGEVSCAEELPPGRLNHYLRVGALAPHVLIRVRPLPSVA